MMLTLAACAEDPPVFVVGALEPPVPDATSTCVFEANPRGPFLSFGTLDVTLASEYSVVLLVGDQSTERASDPRLDMSDGAIVETAHVIDLDPSGTVLDDFTEDVTAFVPSATGTSPGLATLSLKLVSSHAASVASQRVHANVRLSGHLTDRSRFETMAMTIPVDVCAGCLVSCPSSNVCVVGQDQRFCAP